MRKGYNTKDVKRGDILFIKKGKGKEVGCEQQSDRPAVVVSNNINNYHSSNIEVVYLTTQEKKTLPTHFKTYHARKISTVLCEGIMTVSKSRIDYYIGKLDDYELEQLDKALAISISLNNSQKIIQNQNQEQTMDNSINTMYEDLRNAYIKKVNENRLLTIKLEKITQENMRIKKDFSAKLASSC